MSVPVVRLAEPANGPEETRRKTDAMASGLHERPALAARSRKQVHRLRIEGIFRGAGK